MTNKKTFLQTATLIEDILGVKKVDVTLGFNPQPELVSMRDSYPETLQYHCFVRFMKLEVFIEG